MPDSLRGSTALVRLAFWVQATHVEIANKYDLTPAQARLLCSAMSSSPSMTELANQLQVDKSSLSGLVDRAVQRGLVRRVVGQDDRRIVRIALTNIGRSLATAYDAELICRLDIAVSSLPTAQSTALMVAADQIIGGKATLRLLEPLPR